MRSWLALLAEGVTDMFVVARFLKFAIAEKDASKGVMTDCAVARSLKLGDKRLCGCPSDVLTSVASLPRPRDFLSPASRNAGTH
ncbi:MAG: hypothetical protein AB1586_33610 [Pseudomonadota bacterium]